jgi:hypothetical protein
VSPAARKSEVRAEIGALERNRIELQVCLMNMLLLRAPDLLSQYIHLMNISNISNERLDEFRRLYFEEYGEEITRDEASIRAMQLMDLYRLLMDLETHGDPPAQNGPAAA